MASTDDIEATPGENLAAVLGAFLEAQRNGRLDALKALLAPDVEWRGAMPGTLCANRREVLTFLGRRFSEGRRMRITRLEAFESGDRVVLSALGPDFHPGGDTGPEGELYLAFTMRAGRVVAMRGASSREEALA